MGVYNFYNIISGWTLKHQNIKHQPNKEDFGTLGLNLVHDLSSSITALLLDIERLRLDSQAIEQAIQTARSHISGQTANQVHIGSEIRRCMTDFTSRCEEKNIRLSAVINQDCTLDGSPAKLQIVLNNLLRNAIDAVSGQQGAWIQIHLNRINKQIILEVADSGQGIPLRRQHQIFTLGKTSKPSASHLGVGLVLVKRIVENHFNGQVRVRSGVQGSRFQILIPQDPSQ